MSTIPDEPDRHKGGGSQSDKPNLTHYQLLELRYADTEWLDKLTSQGDIPIEAALWSGSFQGISEDEESSLPYELAHIWLYLLEVGPVQSGAMGAIPVSFSEINHWLQSTRTKLLPWEIVLLHKCSQEWVAAQYEAKQHGAIPPWVNYTSDDQKRAMAERLKASLGGRVKIRKKK